MMVPAPRLLWLAAAGVLLAATAAGLAPATAPFCWSAIALCFVVAMMDAAGGARRLGTVQVRVPEFLRITKNVPASLPLTIENGPVTLAVPMPYGMHSEKTVIGT